MRRKIYEKLLEWKTRDDGRSALLIDGARRVGKSWVAEEFAKAEYKSYVLIDFSKATKEVKSVFEDDLENLDTLFLKLSTRYGVKLYERQTLFIFDEVQRFPRAREAIKALVADRRYDYLETGSLVSIDENVEDIVIPSEEERIKMHPMDFEEFLWAKGDELTMDYVRDRFSKGEAMGALMHKKCMQLFREYLVVGGMPQAVAEFLRTNDLMAVDRVKRKILKLYREDIRKHAGRYALKTTLVWDGVPGMLSKHEKKFRLSTLERSARMREYEDSFMWLREAMICNVAYNATEPNVGLGISAEHSTLKCYAADTGLLVSQAFSERQVIAEQVHSRILFDALEFNRGMLVENAVAQMLRAAGHESLYFYSRPRASGDSSRQMEIDFLLAKAQLSRRRNVIAVEVKGGRKYDHSSLDKFRGRFKQFIGAAYVLYSKDMRTKDGVTYLPLYMAPLVAGS